jgi:hypothetical protein
MRGVLHALVVLQVLLPLCVFAADEKVQVELNSIENADNRCRLTSWSRTSPASRSRA